uniref:Ig-like domain-containing protein n=1 Tax=Knipowitschia caucasica TaxID=637954 RepID=A0AAV2M878_KNICA
MKLLLPLFCLLSPAFGTVSAQDKRPVDVVTVAEGADALLPCALGSGLSVDQFDWHKDSGGEEKEEVFFYDKGSYYGHGRSEQYQSQQFRGRVEFFKERLESGNASITILNTRLEDNGTYTCVLLKPEKHEMVF